MTVARQASSHREGAPFVDISSHNPKPSFRESTADLLPNPPRAARHKRHTFHDISSLWSVSYGPRCKNHVYIAGRCQQINRALGRFSRVIWIHEIHMDT